MEWHSWHSGNGGFSQIEKKLAYSGFQIIKSSPTQQAVSRDGEVGLFLAQNLNFPNWRIMEKSPEGKMNSNLFFIHSTDRIHLSSGQNTDGFKILACVQSYDPLMREENGLQ